MRWSDNPSPDRELCLLVLLVVLFAVLSMGCANVTTRRKSDGMETSATIGPVEQTGFLWEAFYWGMWK